MKSFLSKMLVAGCVLAMVAVLFAAQDSQGQEKKKKKGGNDPTARVKAKLDAAELPADVLEKAKKIVDEHAPKIKEAQAKVDAVLTDEQKKARREAQQAAKAAGKKGKEAADAVAAALKLTDEQKTKMEEAQKALAAANADMNKALREVLSAEQQEKVGIKGKKKKNA